MRKLFKSWTNKQAICGEHRWNQCDMEIWKALFSNTEYNPLKRQSHLDVAYVQKRWMLLKDSCSAPAGVLKQGSCVYSKMPICMFIQFHGQGLCFPCATQPRFVPFKLSLLCVLKKWWKWFGFAPILGGLKFHHLCLRGELSPLIFKG